MVETPYSLHETHLSPLARVGRPICAHPARHFWLALRHLGYPNLCHGQRCLDIRLARNCRSIALDRFSLESLTFRDQNRISVCKDVLQLKRLAEYIQAVS